MRKFDDAVDRVPVRASPDDAEQMGANGRGSKVGRIDPSHRDTSARPTPGPHIGFICLPTLIIAQTHPAWRDRFASTPSKLYLRADYRRRMMQKLLAMGVVTISLASFGTCWAQSASPPPQTPPPAKTAPTHAAHATSRSTVQQFKTEADAKSHCGTDQVVWGNTSSHVLHDSGTKYYGKTTHGAYMCKGLAVNAGYHEAKE